MTQNEIKIARAKAKSLEPLVRIGKNGITENVVIEIIRLLRKREIIKIKLLHAFLEENNRKIIAEELAQKTNSIIVEQVGGIVVLMRK
jgi:RNA-binding protein